MGGMTVRFAPLTLAMQEKSPWWEAEYDLAVAYEHVIDSGESPSVMHDAL